MEYDEFIKTKHRLIPCSGFKCEKSKMNPKMFDWQKDIVRWALMKGKSALFEDCGLGKTIQQLEWSKAVNEHTGKPVLIIAPLAVSKQTKREGEKFGYLVNICRCQDDVIDGINITNYEMQDYFSPEVFGGIVLDESSILKHFSSKTKTKIIERFSACKYKLSCTATPAPNDYMELGNQAEFLGVMSRSEMLATFFVHDGGETSKWRLKGHAESDFWKWIACWAVVLTNPKDLGYPGDEYVLPNINISHVVVRSDLPQASTLMERKRARSASVKERCKEAARIVQIDQNDQWLIWCDLNSESGELAKEIMGSEEVRGSDDPAKKERSITDFATGDLKRLITKPSIAGFGINWQKCHNMIFVGLSDSYEMMYQAIRRCWRFGQENDVNVYIITSQAEGAVKQNIERKEEQAKKMIQEMVSHTHEILEKEIRSTVRMTESYNPTKEMTIPEWLMTV